MDSVFIQNLLENSGLEKVRVENDFVYFQDPSCIFPAFDTFLEVAWIAILILTAIIIFGWGIMYIKNGIKATTAFNNAKTLLLILCTLGVIKPIITIIYGKDLFAQQCEIKQVSRTEVNELVELRNKNLGKSDEYLLNDNFQLIDSGPVYTEEN